MSKTFLLLVLLVTITGSMFACNTVEGAGKDTERAGEKMQSAAEKNK